MHEERIQNFLKTLTASNIMATIDAYEDELQYMNQIYDELVESLKGVSADETVVLDDLLFKSMKMAFLEGMKFTKTLEKL